MAERDPRVDPKAGDILQTQKEWREVVYVEYGGMSGKTQMADRIQLKGARNNQHRCFDFRVSRRQLKTWAKNAEVIHRAD